MSLLLLTSTMVLTAGQASVFSEEHLKETTQCFAPNLSIYPTSYNFGDKYIGDTEYTTFEIWNSACCTLQYSITENYSWVTVDPTRGSSIGEHDTITVTIETNFLNPGFHQCDIHISSDGGETDFYVYINTSVADVPKITLSPRSYDFGNVIKGADTSTSFEIWNCGIGSLSYSLVNIPDWCRVNPTSGTSTGEHDTITININTSDLATSLHTGNIQITSNECMGSFRFYINIKSPVPELSYSPHSYNFGYKSQGETDLTTFEIWNSGIEKLTYSLVENCDWITVSPTYGVSSEEHDTITVRIDTTGLEQRFNSYDITINTNAGVAYYTVTVLIGESYTNITVDQAWNFLTNTSNGIQIPIDVRYDYEWAVEHIDTPAPENPKLHCSCALLTDETILQAFMELYQGKEIILYCVAGSRSTAVANLLVEHNFTGIIYNMIGGITAWKQAGYPTKSNTPPNTPMITGDTKGKPGEEYHYTFTTTDVDSDDVYYYVNWSDNTSNQFIGPFHSEEETTLNHTWSEKGTYALKVKARDIFGSESDYATLEIKMPKTSTNIFYQRLLGFFEKIHFLFPFLKNISTFVPIVIMTGCAPEA
jgi:rhodanese-related sulfurtransferase